MNGKLYWLLTAILLGLVHQADAQQSAKVARIGFLASAGAAPSDAFRQALRDLGYIEGKNIAFEFRASGGKPERNADLAVEFVRLRVDMIVAEGAGAIRAAKNATSTIPIVMSEVNDPITLGFVASLAHPGGNITGLSNLSPELSGKRLELLKEVIPKISRVAPDCVKTLNQCFYYLKRGRRLVSRVLWKKRKAYSLGISKNRNWLMG